MAICPHAPMLYGQHKALRPHKSQIDESPTAQKGNFYTYAHGVWAASRVIHMTICPHNPMMHGQHTDIRPHKPKSSGIILVIMAICPHNPMVVSEHPHVTLVPENISERTSRLWFLLFRLLEVSK